MGPDIAIAAWLGRHKHGLPPFIFAGDPGLIRRRAACLGSSIDVRCVAPAEARDAFATTFPCMEDAPSVEGRPGGIDRADAAAVIASVRHAVDLVQDGQCAALVTNPINKKALNAVGFPFPGHTEFLAALAQERSGIAAEPVMMIAGPGLRVVPVTIHIPLAAVATALTTALIVRTGAIVARDMAARFGVAAPRLAVSGLNPHAGEEGMLGPEDDAIVRPAVAALQAAGIDASGPWPADTMFHPAARTTYDVALCMYHDQALIPIKTIAFDEGVNVTLGLPFIRTSPDHGTALPLAGTGQARPGSLIAALRLAGDIADRAARDA